MTLAVLAAVIALLLAERVVHARIEARDRRHLVNALVAKDARELAVLERVEQAPKRLKAVGDDERPKRMPEGL